MKITFEGNTIRDVIVSIRAALDELAVLQGPGPEAAQVAAPSDEFNSSVPVDAPVEIPAEKPKKPRTAKQLENDERLREKALARIAEGKGFQKKAAKTEPVEKPKPAPKKPEPQTDMFEEPPKKALDPADIVAVRIKTISELQEAYANGKQQEVFELLSRFGNGAKSFRELPPDAFVPISEAIALGALT